MGKNKKNGNDGNNFGPSRSQKLWIWIGVTVLVLVLLFWLFAIGTFEGPNQ